MISLALFSSAVIFQLYGIFHTDDNPYVQQLIFMLTWLPPGMAALECAYFYTAAPAITGLTGDESGTPTNDATSSLQQNTVPTGPP